MVAKLEGEAGQRWKLEKGKPVRRKLRKKRGDCEGEIRKRGSP